MKANTVATLIDSGSTAASQILKDWMVNRQERKQLETRLQHEKEIAQARNNHASGMTASPQTTQNPSPDSAGGGGAQTQPAPQQTPPQPQTQGPPGQSGGGEQQGTVIDMGRLEENESCEMCQAILGYIRDLPPEERAEGIADYGRMKNAMESGGGKEAVKEVVEGSEVLQDAMRDSVK